VVAISQAPSPESDPNPPSPVYAMLVHYTNIKADRAEICKTYRPPKGYFDQQNYYDSTHSSRKG
jgi:hypothetical protein